MKLDFSNLALGGDALGIGGTQQQHTESAGVTFIHFNDEITYSMDVDIAPVRDYNKGFPSLLGMDILRRWRMVCDPQYGRLEFDVHSADSVRLVPMP